MSILQLLRRLTTFARILLEILQEPQPPSLYRAVRAASTLAGLEDRQRVERQRWKDRHDG